MTPMREFLLIGIGAGDPDYLTLQAIKAINRVDVFFVLDKRAETAELTRFRRQICEQFATDRPWRFVTLQDPVRDQSRGGYASVVEEWHDARAVLLEQAIRNELEEGQCGALLLWGDPALYDSAMRLMEIIQARGNLALDYRVIPGITSVQALAAGHRIPLNRIGEPVHVTTGRQLAKGLPKDLDAVLVMLDGDLSYRKVLEEDMEIFWGAYLGTEDEILISGPAKTVTPQIEQARQAGRAAKGWIMDTYLLRRPRRSD
ncbi:precorrin-6A synthase (deacetylating) [Ectothiorhodospira lacustris]|uniref:precorrin-6A synthase (deacetylating) n=1 Tax=Ectothiorhodospira lacustris TaxID=2899127 RepID=UPI001EE940F3|nr:precorrin-6A synthase (deacetylating) [Ectothiorhodospira lacustris]MCG5499697.1 precorrin-6A synthase (deacetylating) [Ectothiorhodospira lacustris]MCG5509103.1 precorrin-6A synthase (deacetylating) [Ectothiorhodospira lacustris]MCG5520894.1 precorrin-6A synthase (deacetylating) [Ectothiorhodospira lacustris]